MFIESMMPSPVKVDLIQFAERLNRTKSLTKEEPVCLAQLELGHCFSALKLGLTPLAALILRPLDLDWDYITGSPVSLPC